MKCYDIIIEYYYKMKLYGEVPLYITLDGRWNKSNDFFWHSLGTAHTQTKPYDPKIVWL